jgi:hypothetical protein
MSRSLEKLLDAALDTRQERRRQHQAEQTSARQAINVAHAKVEWEQTLFHSKVRPLVEQAVAQANRHLAKRPEHCGFRDLSGHFTGPQHVHAATCNPIAYELCAGGATVGEALLVELTHDGWIEASLCHSPDSIEEAEAPRTDFGWHPMRIGKFTAASATNLVVSYVAAITRRSPLGQHEPRSA